MVKWTGGARKRSKLLLDRLALDRKINVCDVGARLAETPAYNLLMTQGAVRLWGFEPDPEAHAELEAQDLPDTTYVRAAVGQAGPATYYLHPIRSISSIYPVHAPSAGYLGRTRRWVRDDIEEIPMDLVELDSIDALDKPDVLKMDIQGGELDVLEGGTEKLADCVAIIPEVRFHQMYEGEPLWADLDAKLREMGFILHKFMHTRSLTLPSRFRDRFAKRAMVSQLLDGDAVYIRRLDTLSRVSDTQLKIMALAADSMFFSYDLALFCIEELQRREAIGADVARRYFRNLPDDIKVQPDVKAAE